METGTGPNRPHPAHQALHESPSTSPSSQAASTRMSCDQCRHAKIKCKRPNLQGCCAHCTARSTACITTPVPRKVQVKKINRQDNILAIESRIARMESLLVSSGVDTAAFSDVGSIASSSEQEDFSARLSTLLVDDESGASFFWGPSSGLSLFSPQGLQWVADRTGTNELQGFIAELVRSRPLDDDVKLTHLWSPSKCAPLPPRGVADKFIRRFFESLNSSIPLFDQNSFMELYEQHYSASPPPGVAWYAAFNVVLAIGSLAELDERDASPEPALDDPNYQIESSVHKGCFKNVCSVFTELVFTTHSILAVQALLGMCFILESSLNAQHTYIVLAAAARVAHTIGLHRRVVSSQTQGFSEAKGKERRNVFWIIYVLENSMAIRFGRPPVINDEDIDIPFPERGEYADNALAEEDRLDSFYHQVMLSRIESKIYTELYSVQSQRRTVGERLKSIAHLDQRLQAWRDELPATVRPGRPLSCPPSQITQAIMLNVVYYNCITTVHRAPSHCALWSMNATASDSSNGLESETHHRVYASHLHCVNAARSTGQLLSYFDQQGILPQGVLLRLGIFYPLSAFLILFANILQNPKDSYVESDARLMNIISTFFSLGLVKCQDTPLELAVKVFVKLSSITAKFLATSKTQKQATKRGYEEAQDDPLTSENTNSKAGSIVDARWQAMAAQSNMAIGHSPQRDSIAERQDEFIPLQDQTNAAFFEAHMPPQISPFISLDLGNIEWDSFLYI